MKRIVTFLVIVGAFMSDAMAKEVNPDPYSYYTYIYRTRSGWNLNMKFPRNGLMEAMQKAEPSLSEILSDSVFVKEAMEYLDGKVSIVINRNHRIDIGDSEHRINDYFFEVNYKISITFRPHYWDIQLDPMTENTNCTAYLKLRDEFDSDTFIMGKRHGTTISLEEKPNGDFIVYK